MFKKITSISKNKKLNTIEVFDVQHFLIQKNKLSNDNKIGVAIYNTAIEASSSDTDDLSHINNKIKNVDNILSISDTKTGLNKNSKNQTIAQKQNYYDFTDLATKHHSNKMHILANEINGVDLNILTNTTTSLNNASRDIWGALLSYIKTTYGESVYNNWFKNLEFGKILDGVLLILAPTKFIKELIVKNYAGVMSHYISKIDPKLCAIEVKLKENNYTKQVFVVEGNEEGVPSLIQKELDLSTTGTHDHQSMYVKKQVEDYKICDVKKTTTFNGAISLNSNFIFEKFICAESNSVAYNAAKKIASLICSNSSQIQNDMQLDQYFNQFRTLYVHGPIGMGKSHLLQSIAHYIIQNNNKLSIAYLTAERFTQQYVSSVKSNTLIEFKRILNKLDVLIIDDLQLICGRSGTEKEFVNIFDSLLEYKGRRIILAADSTPHSLDFSNRTKSRLAGCMTVGIDQADHNLRFRILKSKSCEIGINLSDELLSIIAEKVDVSIRELEAMLYKIVTYCSLSGIAIDCEIVLKLTKEYAKENISQYESRKIFSTKSEIKNQISHKKNHIINNSCRSIKELSSEICRSKMDRKSAIYQTTNNVLKIDDNHCTTGIEQHSYNDSCNYNIADTSKAPNQNSLESNQNNTVNIILTNVIDEFQISREDLLFSNNRTKKLLAARQIYAFLLREILYLPYTKIGEELGGRNHSTIIYLINTLHKTLDCDDSGNLRQLFHSLTTKLSTINEYK